MPGGNKKVTLFVTTRHYRVNILSHTLTLLEAVITDFLIQKLFLKNLLYSQGNTCVGVSFLNKAADFFLVNISKFLRAAILKNICERLLPHPVEHMSYIRHDSVQVLVLLIV